MKKLLMGVALILLFSVPAEAELTAEQHQAILLEWLQSSPPAADLLTYFEGTNLQRNTLLRGYLAERRAAALQLKADAQARLDAIQALVNAAQ